MPIITITNTVASQALRGQNVKVTVDLATQSAEFAQLQIGQYCDFGVEGYIYRIDNFGNSFEIIPAQPNFSFGDDEGYLFAPDYIDITV